MLLAEKTMEGVVQRVGLGKVFQEAFQNPCLPRTGVEGDYFGVIGMVAS